MDVLAEKDVVYGVCARDMDMAGGSGSGAAGVANTFLVGVEHDLCGACGQPANEGAATARQPATPRHAMPCHAMPCAW